MSGGDVFRAGHIGDSAGEFADFIVCAGGKAEFGQFEPFDTAAIDELHMIKVPIIGRQYNHVKYIFDIFPFIIHLKGISGTIAAIENLNYPVLCTD
jgi:hypothetical protein